MLGEKDCFTGVASTLARLGFSEDTISAQGRWSSACYERYVKMGQYLSFTNPPGIHIFIQAEHRSCLSREMWQKLWLELRRHPHLQSWSPDYMSICLSSP